MTNPAGGPRAGGWSHVAKVTAAIATPVIIAILITAFSPVGDWLRERISPTSATVNGSVRLQERGLEGAAVVVDGEQTAETQPDGSFVLEDVGRGDHGLTVEALGARTHQGSFSVSQGAESVQLDPVDLTPSIRLAADIRTEFRPAALSVVYDVALWLEADDDLASQIEQVTYQLAAVAGSATAAPPTAAPPTNKFCATFVAEIPLPEVIRGAVQAAVGLEGGRSLQLQEAEIQALPRDIRPADCPQASAASGVSASLAPPTTLTATEPSTSLSARVVVPDVRGLRRDDAAGLLRSAGFVVETVEESSDARPAGRILRTEPLGGTRADQGATVRVVVSSGPHATLVGVPVVAGLDSAAAAATLQAAGFVVEVEQQPSVAVAVGRAIGTDPSEGARVAPATAVVLVVSSGPPAGQLAIPDVVGLSPARAVDALEAAGLSAKVVAVGAGAGLPGTVVRTDPPAGTKVANGSTVALLVAVQAPGR